MIKRVARFTLAILAVVPALYPMLRARAQEHVPIRGFARQRVAAQRSLEQKLQAIPSGESAERHLRALTAQPHMAGTEGSRRVAEYIRDRLRSYGFQADLESFLVYLPHPVEVRLELVAPENRALARPEEAVDADPDSRDARAVAGFNAYSPSGDVTAPMVYANYGLREDYKRLAEMGVSVEGKIVLTRYGRSFRGIKARLAEENKAVGLIIYSDPADDGYVVGDPYPRGPWRPMSGIQRGSIYYGTIYSGDPLTPGVAATEQAERLDPTGAPTLPRIPTMPIAARDAVELLKHLEGPRVPREWQGGLPLSYHVGPGASSVRLKLEMDFRLRPIWNVVARLAGEQEDEWVILGNHHDAWVFGAVDPSSGTASLLEMARALGELARQGWKPRRSIVLGFWDAEEFGLIGSVEWVEQRVSELRRKAVAYVNVDSAVSGANFGGSGTPSLKELVREAAREVTDPRSGRSVFDAWKERNARERARRSPDAAPPAGTDSDSPMGNLGSGSDFTPFFHHAGVPSLDMGFGGDYGVYHSIYDSFHWMKTFGDPGFAYHAAMARMAGIVALRLAEADLLPFDYESYAAEVRRFVEELRERVAKANAAQLDLKALTEVASRFARAAGRAAEAVKSAPGREGELSEINRHLREVEQDLLLPEGLGGRPWFKHSVFAPGSDSGYSVVVLPGVREAVERGDWPVARREAAALVAALGRAAERLEKLAARLTR